MDCHHKSLMESVDVLGDYHKRLLLVDYLLSELMAARLVGQDEDMDTGQSVRRCDGLTDCIMILISTGQYSG